MLKKVLLNVPIIVHIDGKIIEDNTAEKKTKMDRFAVLDNIAGEIKLLGIPAMEHGSAEAQFDALVAQLHDLVDKVGGQCFDTTATNTGRLSGTNVRFSRRQQGILLEPACRRHVSEPHIKDFAEHSRANFYWQNTQKNQLFKMIRKEWSNLQDQIDLSQKLNSLM